jgi:hypothetical protein
MPAPRGNQYAIGNNGGRPAKYKSAKKLQSRIDEYFIHIQGEKKAKRWIRKEEPATVTGLALFLGFISRQSLLDYREKQEFSDIIKKAVTRVEHEYEKKLSGFSTTGSIFALKNMGWKDKIVNEHTGENGSPIKTQNIPLTTEEIKQYAATLEKEV